MREGLEYELEKWLGSKPEWLQVTLYLICMFIACAVCMYAMYIGVWLAWAVGAFN